jgi:hypothetical protein
MSEHPWKDDATREHLLEVYGPRLVEEAESSPMRAAWIPGGRHAVGIGAPIGAPRVRWDWVYAFSESMGFILPEVDGGWLASPFPHKEHLQSFATLPEAMAHVEQHGSR